MFKPGEFTIAAVTYRDYVLVFGSYGTILRIDHDSMTGQIRVQHVFDLGYGA